MNLRCNHCRNLPESGVPLTPAMLWVARRDRRVWLCAACVHKCRGSLLYRLDRERLDAQTAPQRGAWLRSLDASDRAAYKEREPREAPHAPA